MLVCIYIRGICEELGCRSDGVCAKAILNTLRMGADTMRDGNELHRMMLHGEAIFESVCVILVHCV